jgi:ribosome-associated translation inhibitor RaiA
MSLTFSFHSPDFQLTSANHELIEKKIRHAIERKTDGEVRVAVHRDQKHEKGNVFFLRLQLVRTSDIVHGQGNGETFEAALDKALSGLERGLNEITGKMLSKRRKNALWKKIKGYFGYSDLE